MRRMDLRLGRIVAAAVAAELLGVLALVVLVMIFGPSGVEAAQPFAERLGAWVGPISGFVLTLLGGYWVAKGASAKPVHNGFATGIAAAALDIVAALALGASMQMLLVVSNAGRIVGGSVGGWLARRPAARKVHA